MLLAAGTTSPRRALAGPWCRSSAGPQCRAWTVDTGGINALVFNRGGDALIAGDGTYAVRIWNLDAATAIQQICTTTANVLTSAQWHQYVPELPYNPPCGATE